uniref:Uncharacterized protein n=1 Tax=Haptolina brevifila TaxID=156173 RepID=A0A7S2DBZ7_9EUKA|mmetsp:Transcript_3622/g.7835  ORF Transcript_3622/g.7835 Transcript_3622/m.7835 type:complete len:201 (+) Transcript_3622:492-1094(+)
MEAAVVVAWAEVILEVADCNQGRDLAAAGEEAEEGVAMTVGQGEVATLVEAAVAMAEVVCSPQWELEEEVAAERVGGLVARPGGSVAAREAPVAVMGTHRVEPEILEAVVEAEEMAVAVAAKMAVMAVVGYSSQPVPVATGVGGKEAAMVRVEVSVEGALATVADTLQSVWEGVGVAGKVECSEVGQVGLETEAALEAAA